MDTTPFNPKANWKKLFSREYSVQYTEISLRSLSPEVKDLVSHTFLEQVYVPEGNNEACYVDEIKWKNFLSRIQKEWAISNVKKFHHIFLNTGKDYVNYAKKVSCINLKKKTNEDLTKIYIEYQRNCTHYTLFIWAAYFLNDYCAERARKVILNKLGKKDPYAYFDSVFDPLKRASILELTSLVSKGDKIGEKKLRELFEKYKWIPCLDIQNREWNFNEFKSHLKEFKKKKQVHQLSYSKALKNLGVFKKEKEMLDNAKLFAYIKDLRDDFRRQGIFYIRNSLFKEIASRINISIQDMAYLQEKEIIEMLKNPISSGKNRILINERKKGFVMMHNSCKETICVSGKNIENVMVNLGLAKANNSLDFFGTTASRGVAKGIAVIVKGVNDLKKVTKGDIIVAVTTHPDYVPAMQRAAAIVTDEGGITSHAAIVSRELGIPCVVGTRNATEKLYDGDLIVVDANKGLIKKIK